MSEFMRKKIKYEGLRSIPMVTGLTILYRVRLNITIYIIIRVHSAFSLVASCVLLKYTRTDDVS